ncbi:hypothetical protein Tco_0746271 [Tanacetum coccineum]
MAFTLMRIEESFNVTFDESLLEPKSSPSVEDDTINEPIVQDLNGSSLLQVNVSDEGYPKSVKESRVITEYLVNISKRRAFWSLNEDILKITILTTNTPYSSRKIRRIRACTHQRPQRKLDQYAVSSEDQYAVLEI